MNLGWITMRFGGPGGTEKYSADLARYLVGQGHEITVYCASAHESAAETGARVVPLGAPGNPPRNERELWVASGGVDRGRHDLVQGFSRVRGHDLYRAGGGVHAAWLRASGAVRRVRAALSPSERWTLWADREAARRARMVVCNSRRAADEVIRWHDVPIARVRVARNGVDGLRFRPDPERREAARNAWGVGDRARVAMFLGTGFQRKGLAVAAAAFGRAARSQDRFVVIGRDARASWRIARIRRTLGSQLIYQGPVDDPERWLPGADATLLPTRYDAAANSTLEALSCGVPAITSGMDGCGEVIGDRRLVVLDPDDAKGFADALTWAWEAGPGLAECCRGAAAGWTVERNGKTMESLYNELIDG